jgi:hypothetical protein
MRAFIDSIGSGTLPALNDVTINNNVVGIATQTVGSPVEVSTANGAPEEIRTPDPQIRSLVLYPAELRARRVVAIDFGASWQGGGRATAVPPAGPGSP